jgi:hypothetical protein
MHEAWLLYITLPLATQIFKTLETSNPTAVPAPADGVTLLAPTDAAFVSLLADSGGCSMSRRRIT